MPRMPQRLRKLVGTLVLVAFLVVYSLFAMAIGATRFADAGFWGQLAFFVVAGLAWLVPAMAIIWWMQRPDRDRGESR